MREALLIARREYLARVLSKAFLLTTLLLPLFMGMIMGGSILAATLIGGDNHLVVASDDATLANAVKMELVRKDPKRSVDVVSPATAANREDLIRRVGAKELDGYLWLVAKPGDPIPAAMYTSRSAADFFTAGGLQGAVNKAALRVEIARRGLSAGEAESLLKSSDVKTMQVKEGKVIPTDPAKGIFGAYVMVMLLYFSVVFYGMNVARSVVEEKTSRIFEVLLATAKPESLMAGKLLGVGAAGLTQLGVWLVSGSLLAVFAMTARAGVSGQMHDFSFSSFGVTPLQLLFFLLFFVLGFLFYSAIGAGFGASVSSEQEVQQFSFVIVSPLVIGLVMMTYILSNPSAPLSVGLSLFPPCTPIVMYLRLASQQPPMWQLLLSVALMLLAIWGAIWVASRIYRVGILMYGKRPTLPEMLRWMRYS